MTKDMLTYRGVVIYEFVFFRSFFNVLASAAIVKYEKKNFFADIPKELRSTLLTRSLIGTFSFIIFSMAVKYLPLGIFFIIFNSSPFLTAVLSYFWTGDRILPLEGVAMLGAFSGIICLGLARPSEEEDGIDASASMSDWEWENAYKIGLVLASLACIAQSFISVASRRLKQLHFAIIQFTYGVFASTITAVMLISYCVAKSHIPYNYDSYWIYLEVLACAFLNMVGQNLMTYSNQRTNPASVGLIGYMGVIYNVVVDLYIFDVIYVPLQIIGTVVALTFSVLAAIYKINKQKEKKEEEEAATDDNYVKVEPTSENSTSEKANRVN